MQRAQERVTLVRALSAVAMGNRRISARRFLQGLSNDELRYIASYLGACLLESALQSRSVTRCQLAREIEHYECCRQIHLGECAGFGVGPADFAGDVEHKMILLLEFLSSCGSVASIPVAVGSA